jgi:hypothetical protein
VRARVTAARTAKLFPVIMKWFCAGLALCLGALLAGLASIVIGYRQVIDSYIEDKKATEGQKATAERSETGSSKS